MTTLLTLILLMTPTDNREAINTLEDMKEWITYDIEECRVDSITGATYIYNINQVLSDLKTK